MRTIAANVSPFHRNLVDRRKGDAESRHSCGHIPALAARNFNLDGSSARCGFALDHLIVGGDLRFYFGERGRGSLLQVGDVKHDEALARINFGKLWLAFLLHQERGLHHPLHFRGENLFGLAVNLAVGGQRFGLLDLEAELLGDFRKCAPVIEFAFDRRGEIRQRRALFHERKRGHDIAARLIERFASLAINAVYLDHVPAKRALDRTDDFACRR